MHNLGVNTSFHVSHFSLQILQCSSILKKARLNAMNPTLEGIICYCLAVADDEELCEVIQRVWMSVVVGF